MFGFQKFFSSSSKVRSPFSRLKFLPTKRLPIPIIDAFHCASAVEVPSVHGSTMPFKEHMFFLQLCLDASLKETLENPVRYQCFSTKSPKSIQNTCIWIGKTSECCKNIWFWSSIWTCTRALARGAKSLVFRRMKRLAPSCHFLMDKNDMTTKSADSSRVSLARLMFADVHGEDHLSSYEEIPFELESGTQPPSQEWLDSILRTNLVDIIQFPLRDGCSNVQS